MSRTVRGAMALGIATALTVVALPRAADAASVPQVSAKALSATFDNVGISDDAKPAAANLDGRGYSLSAEALAAVGWAPGQSFALADGATVQVPALAPGQSDNTVAGGQTVALSGSGRALDFIVTSTNGSTSGNGTVTYSDGSTQSYSLAASDWQSGPTDTMTVELAHRNGPSGTSALPVKLYTDTVALNPAKTVASVTLPKISATPGPKTAAMHVFALGVRPAAGSWSGTWAAAMDDALVAGPWTGRTLRMVEHSSIGGHSARIRLDNDFGTAPVVIGHATIAVQNSGAAAAAMPVTLTFSGNQETTIPAGGQVVSDGVGFTIPADANLLVSIYLPGPVQLAPYHSLGTQDMYSTADGAGDQTADVANYPVGTTFRYWTLLSGIDVVPAAPVGTVVAFGDSITDGYGSTVDGNKRWPNDLARRLLAQTQYPQAGVLDEGIASNQVLGDRFTGLAGSPTGGVSALARVDRDVFAQTGVTTVIVLEGINDLKAGRSAASVIAGLQLIATEAHAHGLRVIVGTITPFEGTSGYTAAYEANRETVNNFIRNNGGAFDGVVDFDAAVRDPNNPLALTAAYDSGDHLHPNSAGYQAMANAINLSILS